MTLQIIFFPFVSGFWIPVLGYRTVQKALCAVVMTGLENKDDSCSCTRRRCDKQDPGWSAHPQIATAALV